MSIKEYNENPRDYVIGLVEDNGHDPEHLLLCCLKYMSHDDVRDMLHANELQPEPEFDADDYSDDYDTEAMQIDFDNGNFNPEDDNDEGYLKDNIVRESILNGQRAQAVEQIENYDLDISDYSDMVVIRGSGYSPLQYDTEAMENDYYPGIGDEFDPEDYLYS